MLVAFCIPVGPGRSRLIWGFPTNVGAWLTKIIPRWFIHISANSVIDSDAFLLHLQVTDQKRKIELTSIA
jgi:hypothetical protein